MIRTALNAGELVNARAWIKSREGKPASRGMILAVRLLATLDALPADGVIVTREALEAAGFEPDFNVCQSCKHHGSNHNLSNRCLTCGDCFASMTEGEKWAHGLAALVVKAR